VPQAAQFDPDSFMAGRQQAAFDPDAFMEKRQNATPEKKEPPLGDQPWSVSGTASVMADQAKRGLGAAAENLNPVAAFNALIHLPTTATNSFHATVDALDRTEKALKAKDYKEAATSLTGAVPLLGPAGEQILREIQQGKYAEAIGHAAGLRASFEIPWKLPGAARTVARGAKAVKDFPLGDVAAGAAKGAREGATAPVEIPVKITGKNVKAPAWVAGGLTGGAAGWEVGGVGGAVKGGIGGAAVPAIRGAFKGAREAYSPTPTPPPPTAAATSIEAWEANKGGVAKQARKYTPGGAEPPSGPSYPRAKVKVTPEAPPEHTPVRGKESAYKFTPGKEDYSPSTVKPKGPKPIEEPKVEKADYKLVRGKPSGQRSSGTNPGEQFTPPSSRVKTRSTGTPPGGAEESEAAETTAAPTEKPGKTYKDLPPKQYEDEVLARVTAGREAVVNKLLARPDAAKLAAKPRSWWADRKNWKGELGLKTPPSDETLNAFLKGLGWTGTPPK
jgi:hypothetical protein